MGNTKRRVIFLFILICIMFSIGVACKTSTQSRNTHSSQVAIKAKSEIDYIKLKNDEFSNSETKNTFNKNKKYILLKDRINTITIKYLVSFDSKKNMILEEVALDDFDGDINMGFFRFNESSKSFSGRFEIRISKQQSEDKNNLSQLNDMQFEDKGSFFAKIVDINISLNDDIKKYLNE